MSIPFIKNTDEFLGYSRIDKAPIFKNENGIHYKLSKGSKYPISYDFSDRIYS